MAILIISPVCDVLAETLGLGIELSKKTYLKLPAYIINVVVNFAACLVLIPLLGIIGAAIANALASLSMLVARASIGEHFYRCSDNYARLIICMLFLIAAGYINYAQHSYIYYFAIIALCISLLIYKQEFKMIISQSIVTIKSRLKK